MSNQRMVEKILRLLKERGYTQHAFEARAGLPKNRITKWGSQGQGEPTARQAWIMARELGVPVEYLLDDTQDQPGAPLPPEARTILEIAEHIGWAEAMNRLVGKSSVQAALGETFRSGRAREGDVCRDSDDIIPDKVRTPRRRR